MKTVFLDFSTLHPEDLDLDSLKKKLKDIQFWPTSNKDELKDRLKSPEVIVVNKLLVDETCLEQAPNLKLICLAATGTDNVDLDAAKERGIAVCNIREYCTPSVVQHVFALMLTLTQHLALYQARLNKGDWQHSENFCLLDPPIRELSGKTLGLIGLGALGSGVAGVARAFNMRVVAARLPWRTTSAPSVSGQSVPRLALHELLQQADIISLHCPLNEDTRHIIDSNALEQMKSDALLINTARGGLVDYQALLHALEQNEIGGAGIDVLEQEPPIDNHILLKANLANLIVTPHIAWSAREARQRAIDEIVSNILAFQAGEKRNRII
ncbi:MAG: D-2-hydroxyacid dehydrogenase [Gammaproteobacteria bacterium]|nr:D-2-hydroxyacid dehydrogenase [Gammaproteobacteria bacterium]MCP4089957.1 D-2-hydroxyacid dehydrogenase [Gammaproteobacteria bacterium]MCP4276288.1 D-2-hydroxyacid dehydrogenase [Gammaproteobacteria bacterium]MCP4831283.1 D-2-hydroxyacid dehydrogenase [Gammaproteobacteria bacterium]MCP4928766.1 D-2-hydroxyacid dehydrogenase [Gammaproteobacteria bacterium]